MDLRIKKTGVLLRCICFLLILSILLSWLTWNLQEHCLVDISETGFFHQPRQSIDILYVGSSHAYAAIKPSQIEDRTGLHGYTLAASDMAAKTMYYFLKAALRRQSPRYVVLEVYSFSIYNTEWTPEDINITANLSDLPVMDRIRYAWDELVSGKKDWIYAFFPIAFFHENWEKFDHFGSVTRSVDHGWYPFGDGEHLSEPDALLQQDLMNFDGPVHPEAEIYFERIFRMLREKDITVILLATPYLLVDRELPVYRRILSFTEENDIPFLNLTDNDLLKELQFKRENMFDSQHVTSSGAEVVSEIISDFFIRNIL